MPTDMWVNETLYPDWGQRFRVMRELARVRSGFQDIAIIETASHGRVMLLDGVVQITEADEFVYQEMPPMCRCWRMARPKACSSSAPATAACCGGCWRIATSAAR